MADPMFSNKRGGAGMDPNTYDPDGNGLVAPESHTHPISDVTNLQSQLNSKASATHNHDGTYAPVNHTHSEYASATHNHDGVYAPASHNHDTAYAPVSHTHAVGDVSGLQTALDAKLTASQATAVADSAAAPDVGTLEAKVNELLAALRAAGIMAP